MTSGGEHYQAAERLVAKAWALPPSEHEQRQALFDEASVHVGLAQVAAAMEAQSSCPVPGMITCQRQGSSGRSS